MVNLRDTFKIVFFALQWHLPDKWAIQMSYFRKFRRFANLREPKTINEKVNWRKLNQRDPRFTRFADKAAAKDEVAQLVGHEFLIPTLWIGDQPEDIPFDELSIPYAIKVTHGYGDVIFIRSRDEVDKKKICAALSRRLRHPHGQFGREWGYYDIPRRIIIERLLEAPDGSIPDDYKLFVYHGRVHFIQIDKDRHGNHARAYYDRSWNKLPIDTKVRGVEQDIPRPACLGKMIDLAEKIGAIFDFVRIDLYYASNRVYFGEATFYPSGGYSKKVPDIWNEKFGEPWNLPAI